MRRPPLKGRDDSTTSDVAGSSAGTSPLRSPANTRRPSAKTASGASVSGSTTTSPRIPCAFRIIPTTANAGSGMLRLAGLRRRRGVSRLERPLLFLGALGQWDGGLLPLNAEALLVTA